MATPVSYQSFCPVGSALNAVGERWALLVVRDLLLGPRRYSELLHGLGGIGTDILAARLKTLQAEGIVRPVGSRRARHYELTDSGRTLRPVLVELARWGAQRVRPPDDPSHVPPRVPLTALLIGAPPLPRKANGLYEVRLQNERVRIEVTDGQVLAAPDSEPPTTITLTLAGLRSLINGTDLPKIRAAGDVAIQGDPRTAETLLVALSRPSPLKPLRRSP